MRGSFRGVCASAASQHRTVVQTELPTRSRREETPKACRIRERRFEEVVTLAETCDSPADSLYWAGLALGELDRTAEAERALDQSAELRAQGRCRPSLNAAVVRVAERFDHVELIDLDAAASALSPRGLSGVEVFASNCHMRWSGYWAMAHAVAEALKAAGLPVELRGSTAADVLDAAAGLGLGNDPWRVSIVGARLAPEDKPPPVRRGPSTTPTPEPQ